jgi:hypothetical protein
MSTAIAKPAATTAITVHTIADLDAVLAPLNKPGMWDFWAAIHGGAPSTAAIIRGFQNLIRSPSEWLPSTGMVIQALTEAEAKFQKQVETLAEFKRRRDRAVAIYEEKMLPKPAADPIRLAVELADREARWDRKREEDNRKREEDNRKRREEEQQKLKQIVASDRLDTLLRDLREAYRVVLKDRSHENSQRVMDLHRELAAIERMLKVQKNSGSLEERFTNVKQSLEKWVRAKKDEE